MTVNTKFKLTFDSIYISSDLQVHNSSWVSNTSEIEPIAFLTFPPTNIFSSNILRLAGPNMQLTRNLRHIINSSIPLSPVLGKFCYSIQ